MTDKSKWFVYKLEDGEAFGCFRIKPFDNPQCKAALMDLSIKKNIFNLNNILFVQEYVKIIATHVIQDWENICFIQKGQEEELGEEVRYTPQNAYSLLLGSSIGMELSTWIIKKSQSIK